MFSGESKITSPNCFSFTLNYNIDLGLGFHQCKITRADIHFLPTDHETNKIHILLHVTDHKTTKERIDRRYRQIWSLSSRANDRSIDLFLVAIQPLSGRSLQSQQRKPVYFWYSGRSVGSRHTSTLFTVEGFVHARLHVHIFLQVLESCVCKE